MNYVFLPGFSPHNEEEMNSIASYFGEQGAPIFTHRWRHWDNQSVNFDISVEVQRIIDELANLEVDLQQDGFVLIAKSIGTRVSMGLISKFHVKPSKLVLMGIPVNGLKEDSLEAYRQVLKAADFELFVLQNAQDPYGGVEEVRGFLRSVTDSMKVHLEIVDAEGHSYDIPEKIYQLVS